MNKQKLDAYLRKEFRRISKSMKREKERCARLYPDWRDDEYNMLDNQFIWGYNTDPTITPSFYSWDDAYIYYNRADKKYYMTIDTGFYGYPQTKEVARMELDRLSEIEKAFRNFLLEKEVPIVYTDILPFKDPSLEAYSLSELYIKFRIMVKGYSSIEQK